MEKLVIEGEKRLKGRVKISGAKNAALPILVATLLTDDECIIENVPDLEDISTILSLLQILGKKFEFKKHRIRISSVRKYSSEAPYELVRKMRASILVMGPLLARLGKVKVSLPGGCAIGARPINLHLEGMHRLGANVEIRKGYLQLETRHIRGNRIYLEFPSVGATENLIMASLLCEGETIIENAATEPEVVDLMLFLRAMGGRIQGIGKKIVVIKGVKKLDGIKYKIMSDRIEAGTFLIMGAMTCGDVCVESINPFHLETLIDKLRAAGCHLEVNRNAIRIKGKKKIYPQDIKTLPYPGFPTDLQAPWTSLMSIAQGTSVVTETIFENRFLHIGELKRMGADIQIEGNRAIIRGVDKLSGAPVTATDLRAAASLIIAGLSAEGTSEIFQLNHLDRGYEYIEKKLKRLGAKIKRTKLKNE